MLKFSKEWICAHMKPVSVRRSGNLHSSLSSAHQSTGNHLDGHLISLYFISLIGKSAESSYSFTLLTSLVFYED